MLTHPLILFHSFYILYPGGDNEIELRIHPILIINNRMRPKRLRVSMMGLYHIVASSLINIDRNLFPFSSPTFIVMHEKLYEFGTSWETDAVDC